VSQCARASQRLPNSSRTPCRSMMINKLHMHEPGQRFSPVLLAVTTCSVDYQGRSIRPASAYRRSRIVTLTNLPTLPTSTLPLSPRPLSPSENPTKIISVLPVSPNKLASRLNLLSPLPPSSVSTAEPPPCHLRPRLQDDHPSSGSSALSHLVLQHSQTQPQNAPGLHLSLSLSL
jgi:hypothetical protein